MMGECMKENIFDVLMYLFENYMEDDIDSLPPSDTLKNELHEAGFEYKNVIKAFDWLESLNTQIDINPSVAPTFRIFSTEESNKLDIECRNLLIFLEYSGILNSSNREIVIDRAMALEEEDLSIDQLKWIVLMVLLSQPNEEYAFSRMEDMVYDLMPTYVH
jgi:Smg protein